LAGGGTLLLSGNNTFSGGITVGGGSTLFLSGSSNSAGLTTITSGTLIAERRGLGGSGNTAGVNVVAARPELQPPHRCPVGHRRQPQLRRRGDAGNRHRQRQQQLRHQRDRNATTNGAITVNIYGNSFSTGTGGAAPTPWSTRSTTPAGRATSARPPTPGRDLQQHQLHRQFDARQER